LKVRVRSITLDVPSETEAEAQFALFRADRSTYWALHKARRGAARAASPPRSPSREAKDLCQENYDAWNRYQLDPPDPLDREYVAQSRRYLLQWVAALRNDLRECSLEDLNDTLDGFGRARAHRVKALKSFTYWARMKGRPLETPAGEPLSL
jgi:hypothetical protein